MATLSTGYNQTVVTAPTAPSTSSVFDYDINFPLVRELVAREIVDEPALKMELSSANSFFSGASMIDSSFLLSNLEYGQSIKLHIKKDQNPFSLFQKESIAYEATDSCHDHIVLDCTLPCINTLPSFETLEFRFDCEYAYGVRACAKNRDFWNFDFYTTQLALSKRAMEFGMELDLWNTVIDQLVATPATTVDARIALDHPTHFWDNQGTITENGRCKVSEAVYYLKQSIASINPTIFVTPEFVTELVRSVETPYNLNFATQRVNTYEQWVLPGYSKADVVKTILGIDTPVVILDRSPWMTIPGTTLSTQYPLWSENGTSQYVAILDPRVGYQFEKDGMTLDIKPYDCDKLYLGTISTRYVGRGLTFPIYGLIIEFDATTLC